MSRRVLRDRVAAALALAQSATHLHIVGVIRVHARRAEVDGTVCSCCMSEDCEVVEDIPVADFLIDLDAGERIYPGDVTPDEWDELCAGAERHDINLRCTYATLPLLQDPLNRHKAVSAGNRSGKTTTGLVWLALQYLLRGRAMARFWLVGETEKDCFELLEKMFVGVPSPSGGTVPPILPAALVYRSPAATRASDMQTRTVDGALFDLINYKNNPSASHGKKNGIIAALVDEAAVLPGPAWLAALRGRCVEYDGALWLASTATPTSFLKTEVIDKCLEYAALAPDHPEKLSGEHPGAAWQSVHLSMFDNCWVPKANIEKALRTLDKDSPDVARDFYGLWRANEGLFWADKFFPARHVFAHEHLDFAKWSPEFRESLGVGNHVPITGHVRRRICSSPARNPHNATIRSTNDRWLCGFDINLIPQGVLLQITAPKGCEDKPDTWHAWVMDTLVPPGKRVTLASLADWLNSTQLSRSLTPGESSMTLDGALVIIDPSEAFKVDSDQQRSGQSGSIVDTFARSNLEVRFPSYRLSGHEWKVDRTVRAPQYAVLTRMFSEGRLHIASRAQRLIRSFEEQLSEPMGQCPLDAKSGKYDMMAGPVDGLRYLLYACVNSKAIGTMRTLR